MKLETIDLITDSEDGSKINIPKTSNKDDYLGNQSYKSSHYGSEKVKEKKYRSYSDYAISNNYKEFNNSPQSNLFDKKIQHTNFKKHLYESDKTNFDIFPVDKKSYECFSLEDFDDIPISKKKIYSEREDSKLCKHKIPINIEDTLMSENRLEENLKRIGYDGIIKILNEDDHLFEIKFPSLFKQYLEPHSIKKEGIVLSSTSSSSRKETSLDNSLYGVKIIKDLSFKNLFADNSTHNFDNKNNPEFLNINSNNNKRKIVEKIKKLPDHKNNDYDEIPILKKKEYSQTQIFDEHMNANYPKLQIQNNCYNGNSYNNENEYNKSRKIHLKEEIMNYKNSFPNFDDIEIKKLPKYNHLNNLPKNNFNQNIEIHPQYTTSNLTSILVHDSKKSKEDLKVNNDKDTLSHNKPNKPLSRKNDSDQIKKLLDSKNLQSGPLHFNDDEVHDDCDIQILNSNKQINKKIDNGNNNILINIQKLRETRNNHINKKKINSGFFLKDYIPFKIPKANTINISTLNSQKNKDDIVNKKEFYKNSDFKYEKMRYFHSNLLSSSYNWNVNDNNKSSLSITYCSINDIDSPKVEQTTRSVRSEPINNSSNPLIIHSLDEIKNHPKSYLKLSEDALKNLNSSSDNNKLLSLTFAPHQNNKKRKRGGKSKIKNLNKNQEIVKCFRCNRNEKHTNCQEKIITSCRKCKNLNHSNETCIIKPDFKIFKQIKANKNNNLCYFCGQNGHIFCNFNLIIVDSTSSFNHKTNINAKSQSSNKVLQTLIPDFDNYKTEINDSVDLNTNYILGNLIIYLFIFINKSFL